MTEIEILDTANKISTAGIKTIVLQSGEDNFYTKETITNLILSIKNNSISL